MHSTYRLNLKYLEELRIWRCLKCSIQQRLIVSCKKHWNYTRLIQVPFILPLPVFGRTPQMGAATSLNCAVNPDLNSQQHFYYDSCCPRQCSWDARWVILAIKHYRMSFLYYYCNRNKIYQEELWKRCLELLKKWLSSETMEVIASNDTN